MIRIAITAAAYVAIATVAALRQRRLEAKRSAGGRQCRGYPSSR